MLQFVHPKAAVGSIIWGRWKRGSRNLVRFADASEIAGVHGDRGGGAGAGNRSQHGDLQYRGWFLKPGNLPDPEHLVVMLEEAPTETIAGAGVSPGKYTGLARTGEIVSGSGSVDVELGEHDRERTAGTN